MSDRDIVDLTLSDDEFVPPPIKRQRANSDKLILSQKELDIAQCNGPEHVMTNLPPAGQLRNTPLRAQRNERNPDGSKNYRVNPENVRTIAEMVNKDFQAALIRTEEGLLVCRGDDHTLGAIFNSVHLLDRLLEEDPEMSHRQEINLTSVFLAFLKKDFPELKKEGLRFTVTRRSLIVRWDAVIYGLYYGEQIAKSLCAQIEAMEDSFSFFTITCPHSIYTDFADALSFYDTREGKAYYACLKRSHFPSFPDRLKSLYYVTQEVFEFFEPHHKDSLQTWADDFHPHDPSVMEPRYFEVVISPRGDALTARITARPSDINAAVNQFYSLLVDKVRTLENVLQVAEETADTSFTELEIEKKIAERNFQSRGLHDRDFSERPCDICADDERLVGKRCECEFEQCVWCWSQVNRCPQCRREIIP